jgi:Protein of unknown function DUF262/Protein of unknown function (DUF1524)
MKITPSPLTISQLFSSKNEQFYVPAYQRRYAWTGKQLGELFDDINLLKENETHLLSTIVFLTENHTAGINQLEVVDGQQRLTSITILLKVLHDKFIAIGQKDTANEIKSYLKCVGIDRKEKNKLLLGELDNPDFIKIIEKEDLYEIHDDEIEEEFDEDEIEEESFNESIINQKLLQAYYDFNWRIEEEEVDPNVFYFKLVNNLMVIRLDVGHAKDAYKLFETINNRGLKLSPTDIIKNFLLGNASIAGEKVIEKVKGNWQDLIVKLDGINTDDFFRQWLAGTLTRKIPLSRLVDEFKIYYMKTVKEAELLSRYHYYQGNELEDDDENENGKNESIEVIKTEDNKDKAKVDLVDFTSTLKIAADIYAKIQNQQFSGKRVNDSLESLRRIKSFPSYIFLLNLFHRNLNEKAFIRILRMIETFMLRRHICEYRTSELDDIFSKLVEVTTENIEKQVADKLKEVLPSDGEFEEKLSRYRFKGNFDRAKYMLENIEYKLIDDKKEYKISSGDDVHLEHIIPQTIDTKKAKKELGDWVEYLGDKAKDKHPVFVNMIGNLTLLASELNIVASNNPFLAKKKEYKQSNLRITRMVAENYSAFKYKQVDERSKELAELAVEIWKI